jgi:hypothetical protein
MPCWQELLKKRYWGGSANLQDKSALYLLLGSRLVFIDDAGEVIQSSGRATAALRISPLSLISAYP